jgi:membrane-associated phospholipid phosphatase
MVCPQAVWCLAALHVLNVCTSRLYLGVHFMADILGGLAIGTGCIAACMVLVLYHGFWHQPLAILPAYYLLQ